MRDFNQKIKIITFSLLLSLISCASSPENYTAVYLHSIRIGSQSTEIPLIVNTLTSQTTLFSNSNRKYAAQIEAGRQSDIFIDKIEVNGDLVPSFPFTLQIDPTKLNNVDIQGEFGFGINNQNTSDFIESLYTNQIINKRVFEIDTPKDKNDITLNFEPNVNEFKFCDLTDRSDLTEDNLYREAWICKLSHVIIGSTSEDLIWDEAHEVNGRITFDSRTKYIFIPTDYIDYFSKMWEMKNNKCKLGKNLKNEEKYFVCEKGIKEKLATLKSLYFIIDGFGYRLTPSELFEENFQNYVSIIRFVKPETDIWVLGSPFFKQYKMVLDYDEKSIGFHGNNILNFTDGYETWVKEESENIVETFMKQTNETKLMMVGTVLGSLIILIVLFCFIRSFKRENPKYHIELNEQYNKKDFYN